jgi:hypothetical protein
MWVALHDRQPAAETRGGQPRLGLQHLALARVGFPAEGRVA